MAEAITVIPLWKNHTVSNSGGTSGTIWSDTIDLSDVARVGDCGLHVRVKPKSGAGSCGSSYFWQEYAFGPGEEFIRPGKVNVDWWGGHFGTISGDTEREEFFTFTPVLAPLLRIGMHSGTSGSSLVTAELVVR